MLPEGWIPYSLGELMTFRNGLNYTRSDIGESIKVVGVGDFKTRSTLQDSSGLDTITVSGQVGEEDLLQDGDLLFVRSNGNKALIGRCLYFPNVTERLSFSGFTIRGRVDAKKLDPEFASYLLRADYATAQMHLGGGGTNISNLSQAILNGVRVAVPTLGEQEQIKQRLKTWDSAIHISEKLLANSRIQKKTISQSLLSGRIRLSQSTPWKQKRIADLITESRVPGTSGDVAQKLTVKLYGKGVVAKEERRQGSESTAYYQRRAGQFIYSKLDFLNGAFGLIPGHLDGYESTLDLPAFDFLDEVDPRWFLYYVRRETFYEGHLGLANGGRKARRVNPPDLLRVNIDCPALSEQQAIADAIDVAIADERKWETTLSLLRAEKRALMQDLLTGKRRVRLPASETAISPP